MDTYELAMGFPHRQGSPNPFWIPKTSKSLQVPTGPPYTTQDRAPAGASGIIHPGMVQSMIYPVNIFLTRRSPEHSRRSPAASRVLRIGAAAPPTPLPCWRPPHVHASPPPPLTTTAPRRTTTGCDRGSKSTLDRGLPVP